MDSEQLVHDLGRDLARFVGSRVADPTAAEDVLQETWLRVQRALPTLDDEARVTAWVYQIARNAVVDHYRKRPAAPLPDELAEEEAPAPVDEDLNTVVATWLRPFLAGLPPADREVLEWVELEGMSQRALAEKLALSPSGARSRVQRARRKLRAALEQCCRFELDRRGNVLSVEPKACDACCD